MENISVNIRIKPTSVIVDSDSYFKIEGKSLVNSKTRDKLTFDNIIQESMTNEGIFNSIVLPVITDLHKGINVTILTYGQTSTGKTHTMRGSNNDPGIIPRTIFALFNDLSTESEIKASYYEIYNETVNDLLDPTKQNLEIREINKASVYVENLTEVKVRNFRDAEDLLNKGDGNKKIAETKLNDKSSRSHSVFKIEIKNKKFKGILNLVDLAGSEGVSKTATQGVRLKEGSNINKSLLSLSNVISKLSSTTESKYISYRDSKLTRLLQASLSGNSKTMIICTISALKPNYSETWNTLSFGSRAKCIKTTVKPNEIVDESKKMSLENTALKNRLRELESIVDQSRSKSPNNRGFDEEFIVKRCPSSSSKKDDKIQNLYKEFTELKNLIMSSKVDPYNNIRPVEKPNTNFSLTNNKNDNFNLLSSSVCDSSSNCLSKVNSLRQSSYNQNKMSESAKKINEEVLMTSRPFLGPMTNHLSRSTSCFTEKLAGMSAIQSKYTGSFDFNMPSYMSTNQTSVLIKENEDLKASINEMQQNFNNAIYNKDLQLREIEGSLNYTIEGCDKIVKEAHEKLEVLGKENEDLKSLLSMKESEALSLSAKVKGLEADNLSLKSQFNNNDTIKTLNIIETKYKELINLHESNSQAMKKMKEELLNYQQKNSALQEEKSNLSVQLERLKTDKLSQESQISILKKSNESLTHENKTLKSDIESYKTEICQLKEKISKSKFEALRVGKTNEAGNGISVPSAPVSLVASSLNQSLFKDIEEKKTQIIDLEAKLSELSEVKRENGELQTLIDEIFEKMNEMQGELAVKDKLIEELKLNPQIKNQQLSANMSRKTITPGEKTSNKGTPGCPSQFTIVSDFSFQEPVIDSTHKTPMENNDQAEAECSSYVLKLKEDDSDQKGVKNGAAHSQAFETNTKNNQLKLLLSKKRGQDEIQKTNSKKTPLPQSVSKFESLLKNIKPSSLSSSAVQKKR